MTRKTSWDKSTIVSEAHEYDIVVTKREIFLHSYYDGEEDGGVDYRVANKFLKNLKILESLNNDPIIVHQHSIGGDWESGMIIYVILTATSCPLIFVCHGIAASMGSIIPQAVFKKGIRLTMPNCCWLIHEGYEETAGTVKQFNSYHEFSKSTMAQLYDIYCDRCQNSGDFFSNMTKKQCKAYLRRKLKAKEDWWFTAQEAVSYGFADGVFGSKEYPTIEKIKSLLV